MPASVGPPVVIEKEEEHVRLPAGGGSAQYLQAQRFGCDCCEQQLLAAGFLTEPEIEEWKTEAAEEVQTAVALAQQEAAPDPFADDWIVYASPELAEES